MVQPDLKKIKELVEIINSKTASLETRQYLLSQLVQMIKDQQSVMNNKLDNHNKRLDKITAIQNSHTKTLKDHSQVLRQMAQVLDENSETLNAHTASLMKLESMLAPLQEIYDEVKGTRRQVNDHEGRLTVLEAAWPVRRVLTRQS